MVSFIEFKTLEIILLNDGVCQIDLARLIFKDRGTTSRLVDSLENKKMIKRLASTKNKKLVKTLHITQKGKDILDAYTPNLQNMVNELYKEVSKDDIEKMKQTLLQIKDCVSGIVTKKI